MDVTTAEEMMAYIERTKISSGIKQRYQLWQIEIQAVYELVSVDAYRAITLAFDYGMAKGYRAAKAEQKKRG